MEVAIIDYKMSNLHSVQAACKKVGLKSVITSESDQIMNSKIAILPGVGAFGEAMIHLNKLGLTDCIKKFVETGRPLVGICLGLQLLFDESEEFGTHKGLGLVPGKVKKFSFDQRKSTKYPVPQVGWNKISKSNVSWNDTLLKNNKDGDFMYFVHSYYVSPNNKKIILSNTTYGNEEYCSAIKYRNIFATQFHPEKSGDVGMKIYHKLKNNLRVE